MCEVIKCHPGNGARRKWVGDVSELRGSLTSQLQNTVAHIPLCVYRASRTPGRPRQSGRPPPLSTAQFNAQLTFTRPCLGSTHTHMQERLICPHIGRGMHEHTTLTYSTVYLNTSKHTDQAWLITSTWAPSPESTYRWRAARVFSKVFKCCSKYFVRPKIQSVYHILRTILFELLNYWG